MLKRDLCLYNRLRFAYLVATFSGKAPLNRNRTFLSGNHTLQFSCSSLDMFYSDRKKTCHVSVSCGFYMTGNSPSPCSSSLAWQWCNGSLSLQQPERVRYLKEQKKEADLSGIISTGFRVFFHTSTGACRGLPVFPEVGSMMVSPGLRIPALSASSTIRRLILSLTLPPALKNSHLATTPKKVSQ